MVIYEPAPPITDLNPSAPADLQRIVRRCLAKDPDERFQSIKEVAIELKELRRELQGAGIDTTATPPSRSETTTSTEGEGTSSQSLSPTTDTPSLSAKASSAEYVATGIKQHKLAVAVGLVVLVAGITAFALYLRGRNADAAIKSIAVMPFVNASGNSDVEYLSDGMTETLISSLSQLPNLNVKARSSVFRYKGKETNAKTLGKELNVQAILNGRVTQHGDQLTLSLELVDVATENAIWSQQYNRKQTDLVSLQSEIARDVSNKLKTKLSGVDEQRLGRTYTANPEAYELYLKGRFYWNQRTGESLKKSIGYFNQAIDRDPKFALGYAGLAETYVLFTSFAAGSPQESFPKAKTAAMKAIEIDDTLAEAHTALAYELLQYDWNFTASIREFQRAIELNPNYATAHQWYGETLSSIGKLEEGIVELKRARELDPFSLIINADLGEGYYFARQYDKAIEQLRQTVEMDQSFYYAHWRLAVAYELKGSHQEALAEYQKARQLNDDPLILSFLGYSYANSGKRDEALKTLGQLKEIAKQRYVPAHRFAVVYAALGEKDQAFQWLEQGYQNRDRAIITLKVDPMFDNLRSDQRFADLVRRIGLPQ